MEALLAERERRRNSAKTLEDIEATRERCKTLIGFVREAWHALEPAARYIHSWHHDAICEHLEAIHRGQITRLQINQPPRTLKSQIASILFNAWEWGPAGSPGIRYLTTAYAETWARTHARKTRDLVQSEWFRAHWPNVYLVRDSETDFENNYGGIRLAKPFASLTSGGGNRVIIDDPHSTEQAESDADRERAERIFRESVTSRLNDPEHDAIVVIMHRLHPNDVCGVITDLGLPYTKLVLPMEYVRSLSITTPFFADPRKEDGELLCPERIPREIVEQNKIELGTHAFATQYQQQARGREGTQFFSEVQFLVDGRPIEMPATCDAVFAVIDSATKTGKEHDATGVVFCAYIRYPEQKLIIIDWDIVQIEGAMLEIWLPQVFKQLEEYAMSYKARSGTRAGVFIEDKASGMILLQQAKNRNLNVHPIESKLTSVGKSERAISVSGYVNKGWVKINKHAYEKVTMYKGRARNHLLSQVTGFRIGVADQDDDLLDAAVYSIALSLGNQEGF